MSAIHRAIAPLLALPPDIASDAAVCDALEAFAERAQSLTRAEIVEAAQLAVHLLECVRSEWLSADCETAIACVLREQERMQRERRRAA